VLNRPRKPRVCPAMSLALAVPLDMRKPAEPRALTEGRDPAAAAVAQRDAALVDRYRAGDASAFDELVRRYQRPLYYLALRYVRVEADAKDLAQRTFVKVFGALSGFRADSSFRTWIYRIAINLCLNHLRDRKREEIRGELGDALPAPGAGGERALLDRERGARLRDAIAELPPKQRMVLELRVYDELPFREVAELVGCSENSAKVNFHHATRRLRAILGAGSGGASGTDGGGG
jgi:RNA polymerase sigma-70 factor, ECF subfamily